MKKICSVFLTLALLLSLSIPAFAASDISVTVEGEPVVWTDAEPFIDENSRTLVPLHAVADAMGLEVEWDGESRTATFIRVIPVTEDSAGTKESIRFEIGKSTASYTRVWFADEEEWDYENGSGTIEMDTAAVIANDRTYAPVRYLAEFFGYSVGWDNDTRTVSIATPTYIWYCDCFGVNPDSVVVAFRQGERYDEITKVEVISASVNGDSATVDVSSDNELDELRSWYPEDGYFYLFNIRYDFAQYYKEDDNDKETVTLSWTTRVTYQDGTTKEEVSTNSLVVDYWSF